MLILCLLQSVLIENIELLKTYETLALTSVEVGKASAVDVLSFEATGEGEAVSQFKNRKKQLSTTLKYLKDK